MTLVTNVLTAQQIATNGDTYLITGTGGVSSTSGTPALDTNDKTGLSILNFGAIVNTVGTALDFTDGSTGSVVNEASGYIAGKIGVMMSATGASLLNLNSISSFGTSAGDAAVFFGSASQSDTVDNRGSIYGELYGVRDDSDHVGNTVINHGTIEGKAAGISIFSHAGNFTNITNYGTITSPSGTAIDNPNVGAVMLSNYGKVDGHVSLESSNSLDADQIYNYGTIDGQVTLGAGNDLFVGTHGTSGAVFGEAGNDHLAGGSAADTLNGGIGQDKLFGEGGNDSLTGGADADTFVFDMALNSAGIDTIEDFTHGVDHIELYQSVFTKVAATGIDTLKGGMFFMGAKAHDANDRIIYNANNGWLIYDQNGNAAGGQHHFATLAEAAM